MMLVARLALLERRASAEGQRAPPALTSSLSLELEEVISMAEAML